MLIRLAQIALTVLVTWLILSRVGLGVDDLRAVDPALWTPEPMLFTLSCALLFAGYVVSAAIWGRIVRDMGGPAIPTPRAVRIFMVANLGRYVPGKVWQIAGLAVLARREGVAPATATGAAVAGQGVALGAAALVGLYAVLEGVGGVGGVGGSPNGVAGGTGGLPDGGPVGPGVPSVDVGTPPDPATLGGIPLPLVGALAILAIVLVVLSPPVFRRLSGLWFRLAKVEMPEELSSRDGARWLVYYTANWLLYAGAFWVMVQSLGLAAPPILVGSAFAAAYVLGYVMLFAPAGVGVREGFLIAFLGPHIGAAPAGAVAILARLWTTGVEVVPAGAFWLRQLSEGVEGPGPISSQAPTEDAGE